jgi:hypothetical protein
VSPDSGLTIVAARIRQDARSAPTTDGGLGWLSAGRSSPGRRADVGVTAASSTTLMHRGAGRNVT